MGVCDVRMDTCLGESCYWNQYVQYGLRGLVLALIFTVLMCYTRSHFALGACGHCLCHVRLLLSHECLSHPRFGKVIAFFSLSRGFPLFLLLHCDYGY